MNTYHVIADFKANQITMEVDYEFQASSLHDCMRQFKERGLFGDKPKRVELRFPHFTEVVLLHKPTDES